MMECWEIIDKYLSGLRKGFHCVPGDKRLRVITPYLYPDNDLIEVFIEDLGSGRIKVTDLGEVFRHLHSQGLDVNSSPEKKFIADTIASRVNIEISGGKLTKNATINDVSEAMFDIITAIRGISDLIYILKKEMEIMPQVDIKGKMSYVSMEDVYDIRNPAYVVKEVGRGERAEKGCVVAWNEEFERLTNFTPYDIDYNTCDKLFEIFKREGGRYIRVCSEECVFRSGEADKAGVLKDCWINSKHTKGSPEADIKRRVDVYVFPFTSKDGDVENKYALHMLVDKKGVHEIEYFNKKLARIT